MAGRRIALLVATDGYQDPGLNQLRAPARGASELAALLGDRTIGRFDYVRELPNRPKDEIETEIEEVLSDRSPEDLVLLYFSCHGIRNDADRLFFATLGTKLSRPHTTAISAASLHNLLDECEARTKIVLLDCCYSGLFHRGSSPMSAGSVDVEKALAGRGTFVITASTALEYAYEGDQLTIENARPASRFTAAVIEGLSTGLADMNRDGVITPDELYTYVHQTVVNQAGPEQTPTKSGQCEGDVPLAYAPRIDPGAGPHAAAARADELLLGALLPPPVDTLDRGFTCDAWEGSARLLVPIGRTEAGRGTPEPMCLDFSSRDGNAAVVGKLGSGKTTLLRSIVLSLALTHTPHEAEFYLLEGAVNRLAVLRSMPHVKLVAAPHEGQAVRGILTAVQEAIVARRTLFRDRGIDSVEEFRDLRATGALPSGAGSDIFLVVDGWMDFHWEDRGFAAQIHRLANTGLNYGVHLFASARRWSDFDADLLGLLGTRVELALDDPAESQVDPALAASVGVGWALSRRRRFRVAVPRMEEAANPSDARRSMAGTLARMREKWQVQEGQEEDGDAREQPAGPLSFADLLDIGEVAELDADRVWRPLPPGERLRVPLGVGEDGTAVVLDLGESARDGMGPHGLCVGATGSGKSELLRTLVLGLAVKHSPEQLNLLLLDVKGGATFLGLDELPHVSAVITDLAAEPALVDRLALALEGELTRRQDLLLATGNYADRADYEEARAAGEPLEPLPALLLVIDEFSELLALRPDFIDLLVTTGQVGRSVGVHMLLASQRLEEGQLRGLDTHLSYRIALRTVSASDSRAVLGLPDAYHLPKEPGVGYLRHRSQDPVRFKAAYVSGLHGPAEGPRPRSLLDTAVERLAGKGTSAHPIWLRPLGESKPVGELLGPLRVSAERGVHAADARLRGTLQVPVGVLDDPFHQRNEPLYLDFSGEAAHGLVVGAAHSGKSTLLRTLVSSFALTHTPSEVQFYCLDFGGSGLHSVQELPHVGGVASRLDTELVRRTVAEISGLLEAREELFGSRSIHSMAEYRRMRAAGELSGESWGDVFLVIDGWGTFKNDFEQLALEQVVIDIADRGRGYGIHLVLSAVRYGELRAALRELLVNRVELRLGDPAESEIDRGKAALVPAAAPGRGLSQSKHELLVALPTLDAPGPPAVAATVALARTVRENWPGAEAPPVRMLPTLLPSSELSLTAPRPPRGFVPLGMDETTLAPVGVNFETDPYLLVLGESESGKSSLLRLVAQQISQQYAPEQARLVVVDYRHSLFGDLPRSHLDEYCMTAQKFQEQAAALVRQCHERMPGSDITPRELRERSWYDGPDTFLLIDDYDLLAAGRLPLDPLREFLVFGRDLGLRIVVTHSSVGASRALYDPFLQSLRQMGPQGVLLSGDPSEGALLGTARPSRQPPGRGTLVTRAHGNRQVQLAYHPSHSGPE
ncbi:type VII secretion protein EccCb [Streptomyces sp. NPDC050504]|uniref:type VII secretion protein EccCb n=1 Tax=Streptomyces sp. NPDC050504 TaxID=3365618 RepID=UPI0037B82872